jgi:SAM (Sterile alpha motif) domain-containing protein
MDVAAWLRGLGLEQYAPAFRDNDVDGEVLSELTADDLISIGVTSVGHWRCWPQSPPWGRSPQPWLSRRRALHLLPPPLRQSRPSVAS